MVTFIPFLDSFINIYYNFLLTKIEFHLTLIDVLTEVLAGVPLVTGAGVGPLQVDAVSVATDVLHLTLVHI